MSEHRIQAASVTKPIQLLAAWLVGLLALNGSFLTAAATIHQPLWAPGFLVVCAAINVPVFLICLFVLQTKFRPEMQEDQFYAQYLDRRLSVETGKVETVSISETRAPISSHTAPVFPKHSRSTVHSRVSPTLEIHVNDMLPNFRDIAERLSSSGIAIKKTFGSTSAEPEVPPFNLVNFSDKVEVEDLQVLLKSIDGLVDKIGVANDALLRGPEIFVGSYAYRVDWPSVDYSAALKKTLLRRNLTMAELIDAVTP